MRLDDIRVTEEDILRCLSHTLATIKALAPKKEPTEEPLDDFAWLTQTVNQDKIQEVLERNVHTMLLEAIINTNNIAIDNFINNGFTVGGYAE